MRAQSLKKLYDYTFLKIRCFSEQIFEHIQINKANINDS